MKKLLKLARTKDEVNLILQVLIMANTDNMNDEETVTNAVIYALEIYRSLPDKLGPKE